METSVLTINFEEGSATNGLVVRSIPYAKIDEISVVSNGVATDESGAQIPLATIMIKCMSTSDERITGEGLSLDLAVDYVNDIMAGLRAGIMVDIYVNEKDGISKVYFTDYPFDHKSYLGADACVCAWKNGDVK